MANRAGFALLAALACIAGCDRERPAAGPAADPVVVEPMADPDLDRDRDEYIADVVAFTGTTPDEVRARMKRGSDPLKDEWNTWEAQGAMTPERVKAFYKQTTNYIYELAEWHLFVPGKRQSDLALVEQMRRTRVKTILDFGGGVGLNAIMLARAGFDVTLADLDSTSLTFAAFRAERHGVRMRIWKTDVEPTPPLPKYDVILALDVLEHLPKDDLHAVVDQLIGLKHATTEIVISAPFGRTAVHPMHMDADADTRRQIDRLINERPAK